MNQTKADLQKAYDALQRNHKQYVTEVEGLLLNLKESNNFLKTSFISLSEKINTLYDLIPPFLKEGVSDLL